MFEGVQPLNGQWPLVGSFSALLDREGIPQSARIGMTGDGRLVILDWGDDEGVE